MLREAVGLSDGSKRSIPQNNTLNFPPKPTSVFLGSRSGKPLKMGANNSRPADYDAGAYGFLIVLVFLTTAATIARASARYLHRAEFRADDALAYAAYLLNLGNLISELLMVGHGAMDLDRLMRWDLGAQKQFRRYTQTSSVLYTLCMVAVKLSMLMLLRRIFTLNRRWFAIFWWINFIWIFPLWMIATFGVFIYLQVESVNFGNSKIAFGIAACSAATALSDIMLLVLPVRSVMHLKLSRGHKLAIIGLFALGLITTLVSLARMSMSFYQTTHTLNWNGAYSTYVEIMFSAAETSAAVMCVCLPVTRPVFLEARQLAVRGAQSVITLLSSTSKSDTQSSQRQQSGPDPSYSRDIPMQRRDVEHDPTKEDDSDMEVPYVKQLSFSHEYVHRTSQ